MHTTINSSFVSPPNPICMMPRFYIIMGSVVRKENDFKSSDISLTPFKLSGLYLSKNQSHNNLNGILMALNSDSTLRNTLMTSFNRGHNRMGGTCFKYTAFLTVSACSKTSPSNSYQRAISISYRHLSF